jgi:hypothetical protein
VPLNREASFAAVLEAVQPDVCVFDRFTLEEMFGWMVRKHAPAALRVLDTQDLHSLRHARHAVYKAGGSIQVRSVSLRGVMRIEGQRRKPATNQPTTPCACA